MTDRQTKETILAAATTLFAQKGFHQTSMNDIVAMSGVSKGGVYWYFKSKDEIVTAILEAFFDREEGELAALLDQDSPAQERILSFLYQMTGAMLAMKEALTLGLECYAMAARQENIRTFIQTYFQRYQALVQTLLQQGITRKEFPAVDVATTALGLSALAEGMILLWTLSDTRFDLTEQTVAAAQTYLRGLSSYQGNGSL